MASSRALEFAEISAGLVPSPNDCRPFYFKDLPELIARRNTSAGVPAPGDDSADSDLKSKIEYSDSIEPRRSLFKPSSEILLTKVSQNFIKSSHAFSARVDETGRRELFKSAVDPSRMEPVEPEILPQGPTPDTVDQTDAVEGASGSVTFSLQSEVLVGEAAKKGGTSGGGSILLGVGPKGTSLESPLSWEEPDAYFIECSTKGAFFWSDAAMKFGSKVSDSCLMPLNVVRNDTNGAVVNDDMQNKKKLKDDEQPVATSETWGAVVNVSWDRHKVCFTQYPHPQAKTGGVEEEQGGSGGCPSENKRTTWSLPFVPTESCEDPSLQKRYAIVTLLGVGDYVELLSAEQ